MEILSNASQVLGLGGSTGGCTMPWDTDALGNTKTVIATTASIEHVESEGWTWWGREFATIVVYEKITAAERERGTELQLAFQVLTRN